MRMNKGTMPFRLGASRFPVRNCSDLIDLADFFQVGGRKSLVIHLAPAAISIKMATVSKAFDGTSIKILTR